MLDHVTIGVSDFEHSKAFYDHALKPLGIERLYAEGGNFAGYGQNSEAFFWIGFRGSVRTPTHIAFAAYDRSAVSAWSMQ
jgi:catechol 2,3-dioxygenase-like lactoylglutathione lyase family enzyme